MTEFLGAVTVFLVAHLVPPMPSVRNRLVSWLGRGAYVAVYSLLSLGLLVWIILAARRAPYLALWYPAPWQALVPIAVMPLAGWLLLAGLMEHNPLSISMRVSATVEGVGPATAVTRHPVLWASLLWALSYIPPNGDLVSIILFGGMMALSLVGLFLVDRRVRRRFGEERWNQLAAQTSMVPLVALYTGRARIRPSHRDIIIAITAMTLYVWFLMIGHAALIGPDPLAWMAW